MPSQASGQAPKPSKHVRRAPKKPAYAQVGDAAARMGGSLAKSAGHAGHDAIHLAGKALRKINPFD